MGCCESKVNYQTHTEDHGGFQDLPQGTLENTDLSSRPEEQKATEVLTSSKKSKKKTKNKSKEKNREDGRKKNKGANEKRKGQEQSTNSQSVVAPSKPNALDAPGLSATSGFKGFGDVQRDIQIPAVTSGFKGPNDDQRYIQTQPVTSGFKGPGGVQGDIQIPAVTSGFKGPNGDQRNIQTQPVTSGFKGPNGDQRYIQTQPVTSGFKGPGGVQGDIQIPAVTSGFKGPNGDQKNKQTQSDTTVPGVVKTASALEDRSEIQEKRDSGQKQARQRQAVDVNDISNDPPDRPSRKDLQKEIKTLKEKSEKAVKEKEDEIQRLRSDYEKREHELKSKIKDLEEELEETTSRVEKTMAGRKVKGDFTDKQMETLKRELDEQKNMQQKLQDKLREREKIIAEKLAELDVLKKEKESLVKKAEKVDKIEKEKKDLLLRLSAMAGRRLTDKNPDIADLSDNNRPTKLAEKYSELYDNEWTDAFSYLQTLDKFKHSEKKATAVLLNILTTAYTVSFKVAEEQLRTLQNVLNNFPGTTDENQHMKDVVKQLKDYRKKVIHPEEYLKKEYKREIEKLCLEVHTSSPALKAYMDKCLELSWLMVIQDPPVYLQFEGCKSGDLFDKNMYREYTQAGKFIAFFVWPAVFMEKGGALLCKGVVQCDKNLSSSLRLSENSDNKKVRDRKAMSLNITRDFQLSTSTVKDLTTSGISYKGTSTSNESRKSTSEINTQF